MDIHTYPKNVVISLTSSEALQLLAIDLDGDAEEALSFLREKIAEKVVNSSCLPLAYMIRGSRRCLPGCKQPCCLNGYRLAAKSAVAPASLPLRRPEI
jgi:hypothetical protein